MLTILVACKEPRTPGGLECLNIPYRVLYNSATPWGAAANQLLDYASAEGGDALFLDDDVTLTEGCLEGVYTHYDKADIFGLDLHVLSTGERQAGARHLGDMSEWVHAGPAYVAHVSTSAVYIKSTALASLRFPEWDGIHWEDVAFCFEAWRLGLKVLAVPGLVYHDIQAGAGSTKRHDPAFWAKWGANRAAFEAWCQERDLSAVPKGAEEV
jgi:GT2 family glycosyltransferase